MSKKDMVNHPPHYNQGGMNENVKTFKNEVIKKHPSQITVLKNGEQGHVFIREDSEGQEVTVLWLDNKTALEIGTWLLDNVEVSE